MACRTLLLALAFAVGVPPLSAQKPPPVVSRPPAQPQTQPQPAATGSPRAGKVFRPATGASQPAAPAAGAGAPATQAGQPAAPAVQPAAPVTPQAARPGAAPSAAAPAPTNVAFTAGLAMPLYAGTTPDAALEYARGLGHALDSAIVTLVDVFRNTSGQPMEGASSPAALSQRERDRWSRCRNLYWDFTTYASAVAALKHALPGDPALQRAVVALDSAFTASQALVECDNVASMIAAPERWTPWLDQYQAAAQRFYRDFYNQVREVHERDRALVNALNGVLAPARRVQVPAGLPRNPPFAGAAPS